jgi:hypothetical protein
MFFVRQQQRSDALNDAFSSYFKGVRKKDIAYCIIINHLKCCTAVTLSSQTSPKLPTY